MTTFTGQLTRAVPDTLADSAATVVREALATIAAYAHATRVELRVDVGSDLITVAILDNGTKGTRDPGHRTDIPEWTVLKGFTSMRG